MALPEPEFPKPKTALDTVKDLNQIFFFVAFILVGGAMGLQVLQGLLHSQQELPGLRYCPESRPTAPKSVRR